MSSMIVRTGESAEFEGRSEANLEDIDKRLKAVEAEASDGPTADASNIGRLEAQLARVAGVVETIAFSNEIERTARRWVEIPGFIGISVVAIGLALLLYGFVGATEARFSTAVWGGVILVAVGALSASASALAAKPSADRRPLGRPNMPPLGPGR